MREAWTLRRPTADFDALICLDGYHGLVRSRLISVSSTHRFRCVTYPVCLSTWAVVPIVHSWSARRSCHYAPCSPAGLLIRPCLHPRAMAWFSALRLGTAQD